ncbi:pentatricopeptide repeat-containing protein At1g26900, mitochondrial-like [Salvia miltiorrhiza]|uniref:pentatricopeptide repeat-containing protein At1g26900, mitochondrial-like n=1 Tax=Salvia miltiorrhiza TaxID=226208 RepID=UPI0025AC9D1C|nr:pentatricopeptide repeat-containing protein At1g26900, mitochondrial-like [Salvia miltiorrhiza]
MIKRDITSQCWRRFKNWPINHCYSTLSSDFEHQNLISLLQSCDQICQSAQIHCLMLKTGLDRIPFPLSKLLAQISMQDISYADSIFKQIKTPNLYMFNTMLRGHSVGSDPQNGLLLFNRMRAENHGFDQFTFVSVLKSCSRLLEIQTGLGVHTCVLKSGFGSVLNVMNALLHFYCVCGKTEDARHLFDDMGMMKDLVSGNTLMGGYLCVKEYALVLDLFKLLCRDSFGVSVTTILSAVSAVGQLLNASMGETIHVFCFKVGFLSNLNVVAALISMYGKHGCMHSARRLFDEIDVKRDVVLWNCLIDGYARSGLLEEAVELLRLIKDHTVRPNSSTMAGLLSACSASGALGIGEYVHGYVEEEKLPLDAVLGTAIIDMYAKSGLLEKAVDVFDRLECKDVKSWTAMISGCGVHGQADQAVTLFHRMEEEGIVPNEVTFLTVVSACSHGGLVREGLWCFRRMVEMYKLKPRIEHYGCMIDLLGRAGLLEEAYELIKGLPVERDATAWRALLGACRVYGNVELAEHVKDELQGIHENHAADSLSLAGAYAAAGMVADHRYELETAKKGAGYSKIDLPF